MYKFAPFILSLLGLASDTCADSKQTNSLNHNNKNNDGKSSLTCNKKPNSETVRRDMICDFFLPAQSKISGVNGRHFVLIDRRNRT